MLGPQKHPIKSFISIKYNLKGLFLDVSMIDVFLQSELSYWESV